MQYSDTNHVRMVRIPNSLHIEKIYISESMLEEAIQHPDITVLGEAEEIGFDESGSILNLGRVC